jgi:hypothetical protein
VVQEDVLRCFQALEDDKHVESDESNGSDMVSAVASKSFYGGGVKVKVKHDMRLKQLGA